MGQGLERVKKMNHKLRPMTESGILSAITVLMALIGIYVPVIGTVAALIWPLPIVVLIARHGLRWGLMAVVVSGVLMAALIEPVLSLRLVLSFAPVGIALGIGYRKQFTAAQLLSVAIGVSILSKALVMLVLMMITGINPFSMQVDMMKESFDSSLDIYRTLHMPADQLAEAEKNFSATMQMLSLLMPLMVALMGILDAFINYIVAGRVMKKLGHTDWPVLPPFSQWRLPVVFLYLYGFGLVGMYWGGTRQIDLLYQWAFNANLLAAFIGFIQGTSLFQCAANRWQLSRFLRIVIFSMILFNGMLAQILAFTGLFDMVFDYRRRFGAGRKDN